MRKQQHHGHHLRHLKLHLQKTKNKSRSLTGRHNSFNQFILAKQLSQKKLYARGNAVCIKLIATTTSELYYFCDYFLLLLLLTTTTTANNKSKKQSIKTQKTLLLLTIITNLNYYQQLVSNIIITTLHYYCLTYRLTD